MPTNARRVKGRNGKKSTPYTQPNWKSNRQKEDGTLFYAFLGALSYTMAAAAAEAHVSTDGATTSRDEFSLSLSLSLALFFAIFESNERMANVSTHTKLTLCNNKFIYSESCMPHTAMRCDTVSISWRFIFFRFFNFLLILTFHRFQADTWGGCVSERVFVVSYHRLEFYVYTPHSHAHTTSTAAIAEKCYFAAEKILILLHDFRSKFRFKSKAIIWGVQGVWFASLNEHISGILVCSCAEETDSFPKNPWSGLNASLTFICIQQLTVDTTILDRRQTIEIYSNYWN